MTKFTNTHRYMVQYMIKKSSVPVENALKYCELVSEGEISDIEPFKILISEINSEISKSSFKLVYKVCEVTQQNHLVWLDTKVDDVHKLHKTYSAIELEYFKTIFQEILKSEYHGVTYIICINMSTTLSTRMSLEKGQQILKKFIEKGYFVRNQSNVYLGPKAIVEFNSYIRTYLPDSVCNLCSETVIWGKTCRSCDKMVHSYCLARYLQNQHNCPCCHIDWPQEEEEEVDDSNGISQHTSTSISNASQRSQSYSSSPVTNTLSEDEDNSDSNLRKPTLRRRVRSNRK